MDEPSKDEIFLAFGGEVDEKRGLLNVRNVQTLYFVRLHCFSNLKRKKRLEFESFKFVRSCDYRFSTSAKDLKIR